MKLHAIVSDLTTAESAVAGGATVLQLRLKGTSTDEIVAEGAEYRQLCSEASVLFVVNDDVNAAARLGADGVHLGQEDAGADEARRLGLMLGLSAVSVGEAVDAERRGADYLGVGAVWASPTKPDAAPIGLERLARIVKAVSIPVVAIGGIDETNAAACMAAGAAGVAVVRAAANARALRGAIDAALAAR
jgi:thiamine-phosphate pyrophosphorylase